jgi:hypothetical protein
MASREYHGSITLRYLWQQLFLPAHGDWEHKCPNARCSALGACKQLFLEREPPVLCIALLRATQSRLPDGTIIETHKDCRPVWFPERLDFMRSGSYNLMGIIVHYGPGTDIGHYVSIARLNPGRYGLFDDSKKPKNLTWPQIQKWDKIVENAYVLVYVRTSLRDAGRPTGGEETPYARPVASSVFLGEEISDPEVGQDAAASSGAAGPPACLPLAENLPGPAPDVHPSTKDQESNKRLRCSPARGSPPAREPVHKQPRCEECAAMAPPSPSVPPRPTKCLKCEAAAAHPQVPWFPGPQPAATQGLQMDAVHGVRVGVGTGPDALATPVAASASAGTAGAAQPEEAWREFTPRDVNSTRCLGRVWNVSYGGQCKSPKPNDGDLCAKCAKGKLVHGRVDGPIPVSKLAEFKRCASKRAAASASSSAGAPGAAAAAAAGPRAAAGSNAKGASARSMVFSREATEDAASHAAVPDGAASITGASAASTPLQTRGRGRGRGKGRR